MAAVRQKIVYKTTTANIITTSSSKFTHSTLSKNETTLFSLESINTTSAPISTIHTSTYIYKIYPYGVYHGERNKYGEANGNGSFVYLKGDSYVGGIKSGKHHGQGIYYSQSGYRYEGQWRNGLFHGHGIANYTNGDLYNGTWRKNKKHGYGIMYFEDGSQYKGYWENGTFIE